MSEDRHKRHLDSNRVKSLLSPDEKRLNHALNSLVSYWPRNQELIRKVVLTDSPIRFSGDLPPRLKMVRLPEWASEIGVNGQLLVPLDCIAISDGPTWERTHWLHVICWYLDGVAERLYEACNGPIHSNSKRLKNWDTRLWQRAWVNRIALFLRRWAARVSGQSEFELFGPLPNYRLLLTHDVDAVSKTIPIRLKQTAFRFYNAVQMALSHRVHRAVKEIANGFLFLLAPGRYWRFDEVMALESKFNVRSHFNFCGKVPTGWSHPKQYILDPAYDVQEPGVRQQIKKLHQAGWQIGFHPSFDTWKNTCQLLRERRRVEESLGAEVKTCRQHWLRFSWQQTWSAQVAAGVETDFTLGFNDRPGFRNGAALTFRPWNFNDHHPHEITAIPLVLMDSHIYSGHGHRFRDKVIRWIVDEIRSVGGEGSVLWHQHVFSKDIGWGQGYAEFLKYLTTSHLG